jgi:predicted NUDIX family NTP pyrophosphohydrolase
MADRSGRGKLSAGILLYRRREGELDVLLAHPGGPYWRSKDSGAWMVPKGEVAAEEDAMGCALREFEEELGVRPSGDPWPLCKVRQKGGKWVEAFALEGDLDAATIVSNSFDLEWPPRSGRMRAYPEVDRAAWFSIAKAKAMILASQAPILDALEEKLRS